MIPKTTKWPWFGSIERQMKQSVVKKTSLIIWLLKKQPSMRLGHVSLAGVCVMVLASIFAQNGRSAPRLSAKMNVMTS
tara:strand:- start:151 stop:384 length:234 start_codon:yes stop_codon:yes gene_type:complete